MISNVRDFLTDLQEQLTLAFEGLEPSARFLKDPWSRPKGESGLQGGGESRVLENGETFERAGVNFSDVEGPSLPPSATERNPALKGKPFRAVGVSVVCHPRNPHAPTSHMNVRMLSTLDGSAWWFGGGFDLTPYYLYEDDAKHWHHTARAACDPFGAHVYGQLKQRCDEYFFLPHRNEARGIGGVFVDDLNDQPAPVSGNFEWCFGLIRAIGEAYAKAYVPVVVRRKDQPVTPAQREWQLLRRGRYVEFNLVHDRGTHFGLQSKGRTESILMSMPPLTSWRYQHSPAPNSPEANLLAALTPRDWV